MTGNMGGRSESGAEVGIEQSFGGDEIRYEAADIPVSSAIATPAADCLRSAAGQGVEAGVSFNWVPRHCWPLIYAEAHDAKADKTLAMCSVLQANCVGDACPQKVSDCVIRALDHSETASLLLNNSKWTLKFEEKYGKE